MLRELQFYGSRAVCYFVFPLKPLAGVSFVVNTGLENVREHGAGFFRAW